MNSSLDKDYLYNDDEIRCYGVPVENKKKDVGICRITGTEFSLLPTNGSIPTTCEGRQINYFHCLNIDRQAGRAYLFGNGDNDGRLYVLAIDITKTPADLTLFYTEPTSKTIHGCCPILTDEGDLLLTGGMELNPDYSVDNFTPHATVLLLPVGQHASGQQAGTEARQHTWLWVLVLTLLLCGLAVLLLRNKKREPVEDAKTGDSIGNSDTEEALMLRICELMDKEQPYLNSELKIADIASRLSTNVSYISACINRQKGCSFNQFVNSYRISFAKNLLSHNPDKKISEVWTASGFANETSFFRTFKFFTGMTPTEWKAKID